MKLSFKKKSSSEPVKYITLGKESKKYEFIYSPADGLRVNSKKQDIEIIDDNDGFTYVKFKNRKFPVEVMEKNQNKYVIMINGVTYNFTVETPLSYQRKQIIEKTMKKSKTGLITAPMPGKIVEVFAEENAIINEGDVVLILEAMKMQNEILSTISGVVKKINIKQGDNVNKDDVLVEIRQ